MHIISLAAASAAVTTVAAAAVANFKKISVKIEIDFLAPDYENLAINVI